MNTITIEGKEYPCRLTVGTLKRFKDQCGKELDQLKDMFSICELLFLAAQEACQKAKKTFPYQSAEEMMNDIEIADVEQITVNLFGVAQQTTEAEKKIDGKELTMSLVSQ